MSKSTDTQKVFVSYSHDDSEEVLPLVERLERETGVQFWIDREGIESAEQFVEVIIRAIDQAEIVLFMLSDNSQHSHWTKDEVSYAKNIGKRVVPIVLNGNDLKGWFLFTFGCVNYIDSSEEDQLQRLVKDLRQWLNIGKEPAPKLTPATSSSTASSGTINGHEYVDLGLSVKWATCNIGTSSPEVYGDYYAWGEMLNKSRYDEENCATLKKKIGNISGTSRDVARVKWGGSWRMPTLAEFNELLNKCTWTSTTKGGHNGYKVTGPNGNFIFFPAAGDRCGTLLYYAGKSGEYWSSTPDDCNTYLSYSLRFYYGDSHGTSEDDRSFGLTVRPVI